MKKFNIYTYKIYTAAMLFITLGAFALISCAGTPSSEPLKVTIIHINDHHSHMESINYDLNLDDKSTRVALGGAPEITTVIKNLQAQNENNILLHAGDAISGTIYYALFKGKSDAEYMNQLKWDAFALGNHEFDDGNETLKNFLDVLDAPTVAGNVIPDKSSKLAGAWTPYVIKEVQGQKIGIIGIDIVGKTKESSNPGDDIAFTDEISTTKKYVEELRKKKINKIIVLAHIGHTKAKQLATEVAGIDIIVTGDSHTLLGDENLVALGLEPAEPYPTVLSSPADEPVLIVQAWEYNKAVGTLDVEFDSAGLVSQYSGTPIIVLADSFKRKNSAGDRVELEGETRNAVYAAIDKNPSVLVANADAGTSAVVKKYKAGKDQFTKKKVGYVEENIPGGSSVRIPKQDATNPDAKWGHFTAQIVADGMLYNLQNLGKGKVDAVIQNAGGVRIPLVQGDLSAEVVYSLLPFGNTLVTIEMTGTEIKTALEQSIAFALDPNSSTGSFPYTAALRYSVDLKATNNSRVSDIEIYKNNAWAPIDPNANYIVGANNYIASGKDGYKVLGQIDPNKKIDTYIDDAQSFMNYISATGNIKKPTRTSVTLKN